MAQPISISNSRPFHPVCNMHIPAPVARYLANHYQLGTYFPYFQWVSQISMKTLFVSFVSIYFSSSGAICVWKFRNIFQNRRQEMVAHELQCLLCKLPVECRKGATDLLQQHLRRDHEVVRWVWVLLWKREVKFSRYEVDMLLHLCLASRAEKEEITKLLSPRLNHSQKS